MAKGLSKTYLPNCRGKLTAIAILARYLWRLVCPITLSADYSYAQIPVSTGTLADWVSWLVVAALAMYNPLAVVIVSILIGALTNAGFALQGPTFPIGLVGTMEGIILFSVLGGEFLGRYRIRLGRPPEPDRSMDDEAGAEVAS